MYKGRATPEAIGLNYKPLVDDALLKKIAEHKTLKQLYLSGANITDMGLKNLAGLGELEVLALEDTPIGDEGLAHLAGLKNLQKLKVGNTKVTDAGVVRLKQAIPGLDVETKPSPRWW